MEQASRTVAWDLNVKRKHFFIATLSLPLSPQASGIPTASGARAPSRISQNPQRVGYATSIQSSHPSFHAAARGRTSIPARLAPDQVVQEVSHNYPRKRVFYPISIRQPAKRLPVLGLYRNLFIPRYDLTRRAERFRHVSPQFRQKPWQLRDTMPQGTFLSSSQVQELQRAPAYGLIALRSPHPPLDLPPFQATPDLCANRLSGRRSLALFRGSITRFPAGKKAAVNGEERKNNRRFVSTTTTPSQSKMKARAKAG
jgi:hypothetical protein